MHRQAEATCWPVWALGVPRQLPVPRSAGPSDLSPQFDLPRLTAAGAGGLNTVLNAGRRNRWAWARQHRNTHQGAAWRWVAIGSAGCFLSRYNCIYTKSRVDNGNAVEGNRGSNWVGARVESVGLKFRAVEGACNTWQQVFGGLHTGPPKAAGSRAARKTGGGREVNKRE